MTTTQMLHPALILARGRVLTMDTQDTITEALAVADGRIVAVGSNDTVLPLAGLATQIIDLDGRVVLPGLADIHVHLATDAAQSRGAVECRDLFDPSVATVADIVARVGRTANSISPGQWVIARGSPMQEFRLAERRLPTREELDAATPAHPVLVTFGAHITVANTRAMEERGITADTLAPAGGTIVRNSTGTPTGMFLERAQYLLRPRAPHLPVPDLVERILLELETCAQRGVTTIHDVVVSKEEVQAYQILAQAGRLPIRVHLLLRIIEGNFSRESLLDLGLQHGFGSDWLRIGGIKLSIDGGFTGMNAAFSEPLVDDGRERHGMIRIPTAELNETIEAYHRGGMRICTHAMGDVAVDMALDAYEQALTKFPTRDHRHRVEHMGNWVMTPERIARTKRLGLLPIPNPAFLRYFGDPSIRMLGPRMTTHGFPFRSIIRAGIPLSFGSDAPSYFPVDPLRDIGTAVAHMTLSGQSVNATEALSMHEALRAQTQHAAYVGFVEDRLGTLEVGKLADLAVLGEDPFTFPAEQFQNLPVDLTMVAGQITHARTPVVA